jgi:hypothetical protein
VTIGQWAAASQAAPGAAAAPPWARAESGPVTPPGSDPPRQGAH